MKHRIAAGVCVLALVSAMTAMPHRAGAQVKQDAAPAAPMDEKAMMEMMMQLGAPGEHHQLLDGFVGTWDTRITMWMGPGDPTASQGTSVNTLVLGGRFLLQEFSGDFAGMPFNGIGYTGYDNVTRKYISLWMDNMGTGVMIMEGGLDESGKVMTCFAEMPDPMSGQIMKTREVTTIIDKDHHTFEMFMPGPDGAEMKSMEIRYTRRM